MSKRDNLRIISQYILNISKNAHLIYSLLHKPGLNNSPIKNTFISPVKLLIVPYFPKIRVKSLVLRIDPEFASSIIS